MYEVLFALTAIFVIAALLLLIAARADLPVIPFYLLAGVLAGVAIDEAQLLDLAQWGIAFLVFLFGIHVDLEAFRSTGRISAGVGALQATAVGAVSYGFATTFGLDPLNALYFAVAAGLSSSLVATSYLDASDGSRPTFERLSESIHFVEDLLGVLVVLGLGAFVYAATPAWIQIAAAVGMVAFALFVRYVVFHRLTARLRGDAEVMMLVGVSFVIGFIAVAEFVGVSIIVGAFAAGIAVADDYPHSLELVDTVDDLEDFFSPIFFVTIGALLSVPGLETIGYTLALLVAILVLNPLVVAVVLLWRGFDGRTAVLTGLTLDQVSAFSLFVAIEALGAGAIARPVFDAVVLAAVVTMLVATYTARHAEAINEWIRGRGITRALGESRSERSQVADDLTDHVVIVDFEHGGRQVLEACSYLDRPMLVIEDNPILFEEIREECDNYVYGDVMNDRVWEQARLEEAALVVSLTPERDRARAVVDLETDVDRLIRVDDEATTREFLDHGARGVIYPDAIAAGRLRNDLHALLVDELTREAFTERGRSSTRLDD